MFDYDRALALAEQLDLIPAMDATDDLLFDLAWTFDESVSGFAADFCAGIQRAGQAVIEETGWWPRNAWDEMPPSLRRGVERAEDEFVQEWLGRFQHFMEDV